MFADLFDELIETVDFTQKGLQFLSCSLCPWLDVTGYLGL